MSALVLAAEGDTRVMEVTSNFYTYVGTKQKKSSSGCYSAFYLSLAFLIKVLLFQETEATLGQEGWGKGGTGV